MTAVAKKATDTTGVLVSFHCPGCDERHMVRVSDEKRPCWGWNGSLEAPTFTPSVLVRSGHYVSGDPEHCYCQPRPDGEDWGFKCTVCHSFVTDGQIQFLSDCTHAFAGQTVPLPPLEGVTLTCTE